MGTMDGILDTVSAPHPLMPLIELLKTSGKLILVGAPLKPPELPHIPLMMGKFSFPLFTASSLFWFVGVELIVLSSSHCRNKVCF